MRREETRPGRPFLRFITDTLNKTAACFYILLFFFERVRERLVVSLGTVGAGERKKKVKRTRRQEKRRNGKLQ